MLNAKCTICSASKPFWAIRSPYKPVFHRYLPIGCAYSTYRRIEHEIWRFSCRRRRQRQTDKRIALPLAHARGVTRKIQDTTGHGKGSEYCYSVLCVYIELGVVTHCSSNSPSCNEWALSALWHRRSSHTTTGGTVANFSLIERITQVDQHMVNVLKSIGRDFWRILYVSGKDKNDGFMISDFC